MEKKLEKCCCNGDCSNYFDFVSCEIINADELKPSHRSE